MATRKAKSQRKHGVLIDVAEIRGGLGRCDASPRREPNCPFPPQIDRDDRIF
ncbi:MAG: hypothetical protein ACYSXF_07875 [Planctomycetota bacterium]